MVSLPPFGMASRAFTTMFMMTCSRRPGSASTMSCGGGGDRDQLDVFADQPAQHLFDLQHQLVDVHHAGFERLPAAEREQLVGERAAAFGGAADLFERGALRAP